MTDSDPTINSSGDSFRDSEPMETRSGDGTKIVYRRWGRPGSARRVVLIHSLAMDGVFWLLAAVSLVDKAEILALDCRGHGASDKPKQPYSVELFAGDVADVMDAAGWPSAVVAGASMGGCVALAFAGRYPERVDGLGLIDTTAWYGPDALGAWAGRAQKALDDGMGALVEFQKTRWFSDAFREKNPDIVESAIEVFLANDVEAYAATCRMLGACDMRSLLPSFRFPVAIMVGEDDYATPVAMAEEMHDAIAGSTLKVIKAARHFTPLEVPEVIADELDALVGHTHAA
jgi:3-oxoadipate enol-lactonase